MRHRPTAQIFNPNRYSLHTRLRLRNGIRTVFVVLFQLHQKLSGFAGISGFGGGAHEAGQGVGLVVAIRAGLGLLEPGAGPLRCIVPDVDLSLDVLRTDRLQQGLRVGGRQQVVPADNKISANGLYVGKGQHVLKADVGTDLQGRSDAVDRLQPGEAL